MEENHDAILEASLKKLENKLGYSFTNKKLLLQALTRESAVQEGVPGAADLSFQTLEFVGDAALKHVISRILFEKKQGNTTEAVLHSCTEKLVGNENTLPKIADALELSKYIIRGKSEATVTTKMKADAVEAILGAISMDTADQSLLFRVVAQLWKPYLKKMFPNANKKTKKSKQATIVPNNNNLAAPEVEIPLTPRTKRIFESMSNSMPLEDFEAVVSEASNVNARNVGKTGNTPLLTFLARGKIRENKEIPRIEILLKHGALWTATNKRGQSADDIMQAKGHDPSLVLKLKGLGSKK